MGKNNYMKRIIRTILFAVFPLLYALLFAHALLFKNVSLFELFGSGREFIRSVNLIPFYTISDYLSGAQNPVIAASNILGNILIFLPLGIYLQLLMKNKQIKTSAAVILLASVFIELLQYIFGLGAMDIDDVILNCVGGISGILIYRGLFALLKREDWVYTALVISGLVFILVPIFITAISGLHIQLL